MCMEGLDWLENRIKGGWGQRRVGRWRARCYPQATNGFHSREVSFFVRPACMMVGVAYLDWGSAFWQTGRIGWQSDCFILGMKFVQRCEDQYHFNSQHSPPPSNSSSPSPSPFPTPPMAQCSVHYSDLPPSPLSPIVTPPNLLPWPMPPGDGGCPPEPAVQGSDCGASVVGVEPAATPDRTSGRIVAGQSDSVCSWQLPVWHAWLSLCCEGRGRWWSDAAWGGERCREGRG